MATDLAKWEALKAEAIGLWEWLGKLNDVQQSNAIVALGAGLPLKVLMSW